MIKSEKDFAGFVVPSFRKFFHGICNTNFLLEICRKEIPMN